MIKRSWLFAFLLYYLLSLNLSYANESLYSPADHILELNVENFDQLIYNQQKAFFIEFYSSWCGTCINYASVYKKLAIELQLWSPIVQISAINCAEESNSKLCREHGVRGYPTIKYFKYMSTGISDGLQFTGDKYNLAKLALSIAKMVYDDWNNQKPSNWPAFNTHSTTSLDGIWKAFDDRTTLLGIFVEAADMERAYALMINFAGDKRIHMLIMKSTDPIVSNLDNSNSVSTMHLFKRGTNLPVFSSSEKVTWLEIHEKITDLLITLGSQHLLAPPLPDKLDLEQKPTHDEDGTHMTPNWLQHEVQMMDIASAYYYMLKEEIPRRQILEDDVIIALKMWIELLKKYAPGTVPMRRLFYRLDDWLKNQQSIKAVDWITKVNSIQADLGHPLPNNRTWSACRGSTPYFRGYTCGIWTIIHIVSVEAYKLEKNNFKFNAHDDIIEPFHQFIYRFLSCKECGKNFHSIIGKSDFRNVTRPEHAIMWFWSTHNKVNKRISVEESNDPVFPKRQFPPLALCPNCQVAGDYDENKVFEFLVGYYSSIKTDGFKESPSYKVSEYERGQLKGAEMRHLNPKFAIGVENVDRLERSEKLLKNQNYDASPQRRWKSIESVDLDMQGSDSLGMQSFYLVWLIIVALVVLIMYLKYRRNRTKFWKTFYYNNYKL